jgi:tRNA(fMet)-specific endonuclease VapC
MILDTNAISAWWQAQASLLIILQQTTRLHLPVPALAEFIFGIHKSDRRPRMAAWLLEARQVAPVLPVDETTAEIYASIRHQLESAGTPIPMNDLWIAAIARQHDLPVISRDTHFDHVHGLTRVGF